MIGRLTFIPHRKVLSDQLLSSIALQKEMRPVVIRRGVIEKKINKQRPRSSAVRGERETEGMGGGLMSVRPSMSTR